MGSYNGTPTGSPTFVPGYSGQAISFTANTSQVVSAPYIPLTNRSFSVSVWIYPTGLTNVLHSSICGLCALPATDYCLHMTLRATSGTYPLYFGFYGDDVNSNAPPILINNWVHAAFTFDVTTRQISIYRNGILLNNGTTNFALKATNGSFQIGNIPLLVTTINTFQVNSCSRVLQRRENDKDQFMPLVPLIRTAYGYFLK